MAITREFQRARFSIDALPEMTFEGFTDGETWNGWACPYFTHDVAIAVLEASQNNGYRWFHDSSADTFVVSHDEDPKNSESERFEGIRINLNDDSIIAYGIGAYSWIWEVVTF